MGESPNMAASTQKVNKDSHCEEVYPCGMCQEHCATGIKCNNCLMWVHYICTEMPTYALITLKTSNRKFTCQSCTRNNHADYENIHKEIVQCRIAEQEIMKKSKHKSQDDTEANNYTRAELTAQPPLQIENSHDSALSQVLVSQQVSQTHGDTPEDIDLSQVPGSHQLTQTHAQKEVQKVSKQKSERICKFYSIGACRYGRKGTGCNFAHPRVCLKFMKHGYDERVGCKLGRRCEDFHPKICKFSLQKKECTSMECNFLHIKGTRRTQKQQTTPKRKTDQHYRNYSANIVEETPILMQVPRPTEASRATENGEQEPTYRCNVKRCAKETSFLEDIVRSLAEQQKQTQKMVNWMMETMEWQEKLKKGYHSYH